MAERWRERLQRIRKITMSSHKPTNTSKADNQESALHKASSYGHGEVVKALVEAKANVDVQNRVRRGCGRAVGERRGRRGVHVMLCVAWWLCVCAVADSTLRVCRMAERRCTGRAKKAMVRW